MLGRAALAAVLSLAAGQGLADPVKTEALNAFRAQNGLAAVAYSRQLEAAAVLHARDMARGGFFSHDGSDGSNVAERVTRTGYGWCVVAENIAKGQRDLPEVMQAWAASPGHRRNMLSEEVTEFALVSGPGDLWVMVLARPGC
jgi:uncharacterized protein YkwD